MILLRFEDNRIIRIVELHNEAGPEQERAIDKKAQQRDHQQPEADTGQAHHRRGSTHPQDPRETHRSHCYFSQSRQRLHRQVQRNQQPTKIEIESRSSTRTVTPCARPPRQGGQDGTGI